MTGQVIEIVENREVGGLREDEGHDSALNGANECSRASTLMVG